MSLPDFIHGHHEEIIRDFAAFAKTLIPEGVEMTDVELRDHAEEMLTAVVDDMRLRQTPEEQHRKSQGHGSAQSMETSGSLHAIDRIRHGYTFQAVLAEFRALRASVLRSYEESGATDLADVRRFNEAIDEALTVSMREFARETALIRDRQTFLLKLSDALRAQPDEPSIKQQTVKMVAEHLRLDRCYISEVFESEGYSTVGPEHVREGHRQMTGTYQLADYPEAMRQLATEPIVVHDSDIDPRFSEREKAMLALVPQRALLVAALRNGPQRVVWALAAAMATPRRWTESERLLLEEAAERTWAAAERARGEASLRESEERNTYLLRLSDVLRPLADPVEIISTATRVLGEALGASRAYYAEWPPGTDYVEIRHDYVAPGVPSLVGRYPIEFFRSIDERFREGRTWVVEDATDGTIPASERDYCLAHGLAAWVDVPLVKDGTLQAALFLVQDAPRAWKATEIALAEETAERTWAAVERARAGVALRESEAQYRDLFESMAQGYALNELVRDADGRAVDYRILDINPAGERLMRRTRAEMVGRLRNDVLPPDPKSLARCAAVVDAQRPARFEQYKAVNDAWFDLTFLPRGGDRFAVLFDDITERRRSEVALRESEEKYRTLFETMGQGYAECELIRDQHGRAINYRFLEVNPAFERLTGIRASDARGRTIREVVPGLQDWWIETYDRIVRAGVPERVEHEAAPLRRWYEAHTYPQGGDRFVVLYEEISDRKRTEEALRKSEERLRRVLDSMREGFAHFGPDFTILDVNDETMKLDGRSREELVGRSHWDAFPGAEHSPLGDLYRRVMRERVPGSLEHRYAWPDGREMWVDVRAYPTTDGGVACFWRDVTERQQAAHALRASEEQFRRSIEEAPVPVIMHAEDGEVLQISRAWTELTGYTLEEVPTFDAWLTRAYGPGADFVREHVHALFSGTRRSMSIDFPVRTRVGDLRHWSFSASAPGTLHDGRRFVVGMALDVTERRRAEEALQQAHDSLEARVRERTSEVRALFQRLVSAQEEERRRIARDIHDHLGQQMTALRMNLATLRSQAMGRTALVEQAERTQRLAEELDQSIDFLTWQLRPAALDDLGLSAALQNLVTGWSERFAVAAALAVDGVDDVRLPRDVEANLYRIAQEALHNVAKHAHATQVTTCLMQQAGQLVLLIEDNGRGFDADGRGQADGGMGLMNMRERAALAGGRLDIESSADHGTSIYVRIPHQPAAHDSQ